MNARRILVGSKEMPYNKIKCRRFEENKCISCGINISELHKAYQNLYARNKPESLNQAKNYRIKYCLRCQKFLRNKKKEYSKLPNEKKCKDCCTILIGKYVNKERCALCNYIYERNLNDFIDNLKGKEDRKTRLKRKFFYLIKKLPLFEDELKNYVEVKHIQKIIRFFKSHNILFLYHKENRRWNYPEFKIYFLKNQEDKALKKIQLRYQKFNINKINKKLQIINNKN